jgi:hypothetical protein
MDTLKKDIIRLRALRQTETKSGKKGYYTKSINSLNEKYEEEQQLFNKLKGAKIYDTEKKINK